MFAVLKHHVIDGRRCEVKKALTRTEMESLKTMGGQAPANAAPAMNYQTGGGLNQNYGPYGMPLGNMGYQQGSMGGWPEAPENVDENADAAAAAAAAGNYGYNPAAPCNHSMNAPCGHLCNMGGNFGNMAGMLGSMLASLGAQRGNMPNMAGPGGHAGNMAGGQNLFCYAVC